MAQRLALFISAVSAAAVLAVALAMAGLPGTAADPGVAASPDPAVVADALTQAWPPSPRATTQIDTVYVAPAATPKTVKVVRTAPTRPPVVVQRVVRVAGSNAEHEGENEGGDD